MSKNVDTVKFLLTNVQWKFWGSKNFPKEMRKKAKKCIFCLLFATKSNNNLYFVWFLIANHMKVDLFINTLKNI